jgi:hypothetical protein
VIQRCVFGLFLLSAAVQIPSVLGELGSTIVGGVHDAMGGRVAGANVTIQSSANQPAIKATTRPQGEFHATVPAPGTYRIQFAANGVAPLASTADLTSSQPAATLDWVSKSARALRQSKSLLTPSPLKTASTQLGETLSDNKAERLSPASMRGGL